MEFYENVKEQLLLNQCNIFVDVGAQKGEYSKLAAKHLGENSKIYMFEPNNNFYGSTVKDVSQEIENKKIKLFPFNVALSSSQGECDLHKDTMLGEYIPWKSKYSPIRVKTDTLDSIFSEEVPDIIKIDTEGGELDVLLGATNIISLKKTQFFVEIHWGYLHYAGNSGDDVLNLFSDSDYHKECIHYALGFPHPDDKSERYRKTALSYYHIYPKDFDDEKT